LAQTIFIVAPSQVDVAVRVASSSSGIVTACASVIGQIQTEEYTTAGICPITLAQTVTVPYGEDTTFTARSTLIDTTIEIVVEVYGDADGTFTLNPIPTDGATIDVVTGEVTNVTSGTTYTIEYTTSGPCPVSSIETVTPDPCVIQQVITPNKDGKNDTFDLSGYQVSSLEIFNRNGIKVYSKSNYSNEFEGISDNGDQLPTGTYFYVMKYEGNEVKSAWLY